MNTSDNQIQTYAKRLQKMIQCKVDVEGEWKYDGFSGQIAEGKIWGRGTVDTKTPLFAEFLNPQITVMFQYMTLYCKFPMNLLFGNLWLFGGVLKK